MRVTPSQLREIALNPRRFVAKARAAKVGDQIYGNPQRSWIDAALRAYFSNGRSENELWREFSTRTAVSQNKPRLAPYVENAEIMLNNFLLRDEPNSEPPVDWFPKPQDAHWQGHTLALRINLLYLTTDGYRLRQFLTESDLTLRHRDIGLFAAGLLAFADSVLGVGLVEEVDVWHLRYNQRLTWSRKDLSVETIRLRRRLDEVAEAIGGLE